MYVFGIQRALYAIIAVYLVTKVSDSLIEGLKFSKQTFIITEKPDEVAKVIMEDLDRGATGICGKGMYSGQEKTIIFCVVNKKEIVKLKELVDDIDNCACACARSGFHSAIRGQQQAVHLRAVQGGS